MMKTSILFDMDGVLIDSRDAMEIAWEKTTSRYSLNIPFDKYFNLIGLPFKVILKELDINASYFDKIQFHYGLQTAYNVNKIKPYKGIKYLIKKLRDNDLRIGIVTSKEFWRADFLIDYFGLNTDILITPEFTHLGKPNGEPIIKALELLNIDKKKSIYIGDMMSDYLTAKNANIDYLHADWGYGKAHQKALNISYPEEILEFLGLST